MPAMPPELSQITDGVYWVCGETATIRVTLRGGLVVGGARLTKTFRGQKFVHLLNWFNRKFRLVAIEDSHIHVWAFRHHKY